MQPAHIRRFALIALVLFIVSAASCAAPRVGPARELPQEAAALLSPAPDHYAPGAGMLEPKPASDRIRQGFEGALTPTARAAIRHDPALDLVAATVAAIYADGEQAPSRAIVQWLFWKCGAVSRYSRADVTSAGNEEELNFIAYEYAGKLQAAPIPEAYGVARATRGGRVSQAIVIGQAPVAVDPFKKSHAPGAQVALKVKPLAGATELVLHEGGDAGAVREARMAAAADGSFTVSYALPSQPGRYFLEVTGVDARAAEGTSRDTLLWVPVYVGVPEPSVPDDFMRAPQVSPADAAGGGARIVELYNAERTKAGKKPLGSDGRLAAVAQKKSDALALAAREPAPNPAFADEIATAGFPPRVCDDAHAIIDSPTEYAKMRLLQPSARKRISSDDGLVLAVALTPRAPGAKPGSAVEYAVVEHAVDPVATLDPVKDVAKVRAALDALRVTEAGGPYGSDEDLGKVVAKFAAEVCRGERKPNETKTLIDRARQTGQSRGANQPSFYNYAANWRVGYDHTRWAETSMLARVKEPRLTHAAVGMCQGNLPGKPGATYLVVVQFAP